MLIHNPRDLASFVNSQRKKLALSQSTVGDLVGLKQATVSAFENKPDNTKLDTLFRILSALNLDIHLFQKNEKVALKSEWKEEW